MQASFPRVAIMGGSIGGLTAALVLRDLGCEVDVYERSATVLEDRGAGIGLHPMTVRYFTENRPIDPERVAIEVPWLRFYDRDGATAYEARMNYRFSSWSTIYRALLAELDPARYHLDAEVAGIEEDAGDVTVTLARGERVRTDLLVCADGISSTARAALQPDAAPRYSGYVAWRGTVPEGSLTPETYRALHDAIAYCLLPAGHILVYPIPGPDGSLEPGRRLANFVWYHNYAEGEPLDDLMTGVDGERRTVSMPPGTVRAEHAEWARSFAAEHIAPQIAEVVERTAEPFIQVIADVEVERMAWQRTCLIGDAAFAARPHAAAGSAKACADAWALRDALRDAGGDVPAALRAWEPGQLALGRQLLERTREIGERSQYRHAFVPGDPYLRFGLYGPGD